MAYNPIPNPDSEGTAFDDYFFIGSREEEIDWIEKRNPEIAEALRKDRGNDDRPWLKRSKDPARGSGLTDPKPDLHPLLAIHPAGEDVEMFERAQLDRLERCNSNQLRRRSLWSLLSSLFSRKSRNR